MLTNAVLANPLLPTRHWEPRCECCRLRRTHPDEFAWLTATLQGYGEQLLTQAEIAEELSRRTGLTITQSQVSTHKTKHHDPTIGALAESYAGHIAQLEVLGGMDPAEMAVGYAKLAMLKTAKLLDVQDLEPKDMASVASAVRGLAQVLLGADEAQAHALLTQHEARTAEIKEAVAAGDYETAFAEFTERHYPELKPLLAKPEQLRAAIAAAKAQEAVVTASESTNGPEDSGSTAEAGPALHQEG